jgi:hypothetical protein
LTDDPVKVTGREVFGFSTLYVTGSWAAVMTNAWLFVARETPRTGRLTAWVE